MFILFDEAGKFMAGRILSETDTSAQVELETGKRVKVKAANILLRFEKPSPAEFMAHAQSISQNIELEMAWEFAPDEEFGFADLARDYFSAQAPLTEQAGMLLCLFNAPHYFRRAGKGKFKKASADVIAQALAAIEKKAAIQAQIVQWAHDLGAGECPEPIREQLYKILFKPDKNAPEYKAVVEAARATQTPPLVLLQKAGAIASPYQFHWKRFLLENFPKGTAFPKLDAPAINEADLPLSTAQAFSIDDSATTEIDDALSVQGLGSGTVTVGIHIAAPALAIRPNDAIDQVGRARLSTVYMPGYKITMLPDALVQNYTLQEGRDCPAVSLYVTLDEATLEIQKHESKIERVRIAHNLRHDKLDTIVTENWLNDADFEPENNHQITPEHLPALREQLSFLYRLAKDLKAKREIIRGKPETFNRPDYNFKLVRPDGSYGEPNGDEIVQITTRQRGAPMDLIVAEAMILANSTWGAWMGEIGVPAIYRSQYSMAPGIKVRMGTKALPHAGMGVKCYAWSSSPLRRYVDLVNQWQIIACIQNGNMAGLAAPFKPKDASLFSIISSFEDTYSAYNSYQNAMERFWTLQYLRQNNITELEASIIKDGRDGCLVRADTLPLVFPMLGGQSLPRGARVRVQLGAADLIALDIKGTLLERLDSAEPVGDDAEDEDETMDAGSITIAMDVNDAAENVAENPDTPETANPAPIV